MDFQDVVSGRRSIRWFDGQPINNEKLIQIIKDAQKAPSWVNAQSARVYIATGQKLALIKEKHHQLNNDEYVHSNSIIPFADFKKWSDDSQNNMNEWFARNQKQIGADWSKQVVAAANDLYNASAIIYLVLDRNFSEWALFDLGMFAQNLMLSAFNEGIDSLPAYEFIKYPTQLSSNLGLAKNEVPVFGIGLGYRDYFVSVNKITANRMPVNQIVHILN